MEVCRAGVGDISSSENSYMIHIFETLPLAPVQHILRYFGNIPLTKESPPLHQRI